MKSFFESKNLLLIGVDLQEKLLKIMYKDLIKNANILLDAAKILKLEILLSELYPKGLGNTDKMINAGGIEIYEKTSFSVFGDEKIAAKIKDLKPKTLVFFGVETHICVLFSVLDALNLGFDVLVIEDCLSSRSEQNHTNALNLMRENKAKITCVESFLFGILKDAKNENFKAISALIK